MNNNTMVPIIHVKGPLSQSPNHYKTMTTTYPTKKTTHLLRKETDDGKDMTVCVYTREGHICRKFCVWC